MADNQRIVEIILDIKSKKEELAAVKAQLDALKASTADTAETTGVFSRSAAEAGKQAIYLGAGATEAQRAAAGANAVFLPAAAGATALGQAATGMGNAGRASATGVMMLTRGVDDLGMAMGVGRFGKAGFMIRGVEDIQIALSRMSATAIATFAAFGVAAAGAAAFTGAIGALISKGLELQTQLQKVQEGVAGTLATNAPGQFGGDKANQAAASSIIYLQEAAKTAQVPLSELAAGFDKINPAATRAGASLKEQIDLVATLTAHHGALNLSNQKILTDLEQLFNGQHRNNNELAQRLGLSKEEIDTSRKNGTEMELITQKVNEYTAANQESGDTIERAHQKVQASFESLAATFAAPIVQPFTDSIVNLSKELGSDGLENAAKIAGVAIGDTLSGAVIITTSLIGSLVTIVNVLTASFRSATIAAQTLAAALPGVLAGAQAVASTAINAPMAFLRGPQALADEVNKGQAEFTKAYNSAGVAAKKAFIDGMMQSATDVVGSNLAKTTGTMLPGMTVRPDVSAPVGGYPKGGGGKKGPSADTQDQEAIRAATTEIAAAQEKYNALVEHNNALHQLGLQTLDQEKAKNLEGGTQYLATLNTEEQKLIALKSRVEEQAAAQGVVNDKEQAQLNNLDKAIAKIEIAKDKVLLANQSDTWIGQFNTQLIKLGDTFELTGQKAGQFFNQTMNTGVDSTSKALTGLIFQTKNWQQAFVSAGESIVQSLIKIMLQQLLSSTILRTANQGDKLSSASAAAAAAAKSAADIPYVGWILAPIAAAAVYAAALAFAQGGIVPGVDTGGDTVLAKMRPGEGVLTPEGVSHIGGESAVHAINNQVYMPHFALGGVVSGAPSSGRSSGIAGGSASGRDLHIHNWTDESAMRDYIFNHPDADHHIVETIRKNRYTLQI